MLASLQELNDDRDVWLAQVFDSTNRSQPKYFNATKADLDRRLIELLSNTARTGYDSAQQARQHLDLRRKSNRWRRFAAGTQNVLATIGDFLESFSGIAEIVKGAHEQFGGLAYGTVSVLVSVAKYKSLREEGIEAMFDELTLAFPRFETLAQLDPSDGLRELIVDVFSLSIDFCRQTIEYCLSKSYKRVVESLSPKHIRQTAFSSLRAKLDGISREIETMLLLKVTEMEQTLRRIESNTTEVAVSTREHARKDDAEYLGKLMEYLRLSPKMNVHYDAGKYKTVLINEFSEHRDGNKTPKALSFADIRSDAVFLDWLTSQDSSILLLAGENFVEDEELNWLSWASACIAEEAGAIVCEEPASRAYIAHYFCHPSPVLRSDRLRRGFLEVITSVFYQLAKQHPGRLRSQRDRFADIPRDESRSAEKVFAEVTQILTDVLLAFERGAEIILVLDRLDSCRWSDQSQGLCDAVRYLWTVVSDQALARNRIRLKIFMVMNVLPAREIAKHMRIHKGQGIDWRLDFNQEEDDD